MYVLLLYKHTSHTRGNSRGLSTTQLSGTLYVVMTSTALRVGNSDNSSFPYILFYFIFFWLCGVWPQAELLHDMWDLPEPEIKSVSPALTGGLFATDSPGRSSPMLPILNKARVLKPEQRYPWSLSECDLVEIRENQNCFWKGLP